MPHAEKENVYIYIMGKKYEVPSKATILKALEYSGFPERVENTL